MNGYIVEFYADDIKYTGRVKDKIRMRLPSSNIAVTGYLIEASDYVQEGGLWKAMGEKEIIPCVATNIKKIIT